MWKRKNRRKENWIERKKKLQILNEKKEKKWKKKKQENMEMETGKANRKQQQQATQTLQRNKTGLSLPSHPLPLLPSFLPKSSLHPSSPSAHPFFPPQLFFLAFSLPQFLSSPLLIAFPSSPISPITFLPFLPLQQVSLLLSLSLFHPVSQHLSPSAFSLHPKCFLPLS